MEDVRKPPYLWRREATYYFRRRVPLDVVEAFGKSVVKVSLETTDRHLAIERLFEESARYEDIFRRLRDEGQASAQIVAVSDPPSPDAPEARPENVAERLWRTMSRAQRIGIIRRANGQDKDWPPLDLDAALTLTYIWFNRQCEKDLARPLPPPERLDDAIWETQREISINTVDLGKFPADEFFSPGVADRLLAEFQLRATFSEEIYQRFCEMLRLAYVELSRRELDRLTHDVSKPYHDPMFEGHPSGLLQGPQNVKAVGGGITLREARKLFQEAEVDDRRGVGDRFKHKVRTGLNLIEEFFGKDTPLSAIDMDQCEAYMAFLRDLPPNFTKIRKGRSLKKLAEENKAQGKPGLKRATRESYFTPLKTLFLWAMRKKHVTENPTQGLSEGREVEGDAEERFSYTLEQLQAIFNAPLYRGCVDDERGFNKPGPNHPRRARFWLPLLGLYTGARLGELCQLLVEDVRVTDKGTPYLSINTTGEGKRLKTKNSARSIPLHPVLQQIGFLAFVEAQRADGATHLFPEVLEDGRSASHLASKQYNYLLLAIGIKQRGLTFHSLRHTFRDALRECGVDLEVAEKLGGWKSQGRVSSGYGMGHSVDRLYQDLSRVEYEGLDLSHLHDVEQ